MSIASQDSRHTTPDTDETAGPAGLLQDVSLSVLENFLNLLIGLDDETRASMRARDGFVVRVRLKDPRMTFHLRCTADGLELSRRRPGPVQLRIQADFLPFVSLLLGGTGLHSPDRVSFWGEEADRDWVMTLLADYNARTAVQRWLREHVHLDELWQKISRHDPSWLADLTPIPGLMREALRDIRQLKKQLETQEEQAREAQERLRQQRERDLLALLGTVVLMGIAMTPGGSLVGRLEHLSLADVAFAAVALLPLLWRLHHRP